MGRYLVRRFVSSVLVLFGISILVFLMIHLVPGDPVEVMLHETVAGPEATETMRRNLGLDQSLPEQYIYWLAGNDYIKVDTDDDGNLDEYGNRKGIIRGDFGRSIFKRVPVSEILKTKFPATLRLTLAALGLAMPIGIILGIISAVKRETIFDYVAMITALAGVSVPSFWLGLMLMFLFGVELGWVRPFIGDQGWITLILPAVTLAAPTVGVIARLTRSSMLNVLNEDYIRTARAKGLREVRVLQRHALRNAIIPVLTVAGLQMGYLLGGAVIVETVFVYPGLGNEIVSAILNRDFPVVQGITFFSAAIFIGINFVVDIIYVLIDPRISYT